MKVILVVCVLYALLGATLTEGIIYAAAQIKSSAALPTTEIMLAAPTLSLGKAKLSEKDGRIELCDTTGCFTLKPQREDAMYIIKGLTGFDWVLVFVLAIIAAKVAHWFGWRTLIRPLKRLFKVGQSEAKEIKKFWEEE